MVRVVSTPLRALLLALLVVLATGTTSPTRSVSMACSMRHDTGYEEGCGAGGLHWRPTKGFTGV